MLSKVKNFFSTKSVIEKIINNKLSEGQQFTYFYLIMSFDALSFVQNWLSIAGEPLSTLDLTFIWSYFSITTLGLIILFISNGGTQGRSFIAKFFSLSFTVGLKYELALEVMSRLPAIFNFKILNYGLTLWWIVNIIMIANIAYRIRQTRQCNENILLSTAITNPY